MNGHFTWFLNPRFLAVPETARKVEPTKPWAPRFDEKAGADAAAFLRSRPNAPVERRPVVLLPTDLSANALASASTAVSVAQQVSGRLVIFHALRLNLMTYGPVNVTQLKAELRQEAELSCEPLLELARAANIPATLVVTQDISAATAILDQAKKWDADVVLLTERPRNWLSRLLRCRTIERVVRRAECPVMVLQTGGSVV